MCLAGLLRRHASDHLRAVRESLLDMESTLRSAFEYEKWRSLVQTDSLSGQALAEDFGVLVDEEVGDGQVVITAGRRLRERPAPS